MREVSLKTYFHTFPEVENTAFHNDLYYKQLQNLLFQALKQ